jgi:hypothetical protein
MPWLDIMFCTGALSKQKQRDMVSGSRNRGNVEAFRNLSADYLVRLPEFTRSTTLRWTFLVASIFAASQLTDYTETTPKGLHRLYEPRRSDMDTAPTGPRLPDRMQATASVRVTAPCNAAELSVNKRDLASISQCRGDGEEEFLHQAGSRMQRKAMRAKTPAPSASSA